MTDRFDYPPSREIRLGSARDQLEREIADLDREIDDLEGRVDESPDDPAPKAALRETRSEKNSLETQLDGVTWAISSWREDATIAVQGLTTESRGEALHAVRHGRMGEVTSDTLGRYLNAQSLQAAPFLEDDDDIHDVAHVIGALPPAFSDWLNDQLDDLNDLGN